MTSPTAEPILWVRDVWTRFGPKEAFQGRELDLRRGEVLTPTLVVVAGSKEVVLS